MSIKEKNLETLFDPVRMPDDESTSMENVKSVMKQLAEELGAEIAFQNEEIDHGFFTAETTPCVLLYHPDHNYDYYNFCIVRKTQGKTCQFSVYACGSSRQLKKEDLAANTRVFDGSGSRGLAVGALRGGAVGAGFAVGAVAGGMVRGSAKLLKKGFNALTMDKAAIAEEKEWYGLVSEIIQTTLYS